MNSIDLPHEPISLPWKRMVHFYGRADEIVGLLSLLQEDESDATAERLAYVLEHQDGVTQATPFAVFYMCTIYVNRSAKNQSALKAAINTIYRAAKFQLSNPNRVESSLDLHDLISPEFLWPDFISEEEDEMLWEEKELSDNEWQAWSTQTCRVVEMVAPMFAE